ncbi:M14 family metallopeptidase [Marinoscillum sp.]|uniref:M14 family metallopeptidase n=1 Tax=Marinoscillum sp. TaxID=2024838 RepID=UPI003BAD16F7
MHEVITDWQVDFQTQIGKNHAKYFDENNWFYFTKQRFDLLYPSYGDTYPTYNGSIGMTYEQGGSGRAGLGVIKQEGDTLTLKDRIAHHYTTGLSTVEISSQNTDKLIQQFEAFYSKPINAKYKTYVLKNDGNADKMKDLMQWLDVQGITYGTASYGKSLSGYHYGSGQTRSFSVGSNDLVVNVNQPKSVLTTVLFEPKTKLNDSLTYDITAWAVPYAFGLEAYATTADVRPSGSLTMEKFSPNKLSPAYGYIFNWQSLKDAQLLAELLKNEMKVRYTTQPVTIGGNQFDRGAVIVTQRDNGQGYHELLEKLANKHMRELFVIETGFVMDGPDIGSSDIAYLKAPKVALIGGEGTSSLDFGATWHFMEQNLGYPVTTIGADYFSYVDLADYDVLIMPNGWYSDFNDRTTAKVKEWVQSGGTLIAVQGAIRKLKGAEIGSLDSFNSDKEKSDFEKIDEQVEEEMKLIPNSEQERYEIREYVAGAVFHVAMDNTHPLAYGYSKDYYSLKTSRDRYGYLDGGNVGVIKSANDHLSGFAGEIVKKKVGTSMVFGQERVGSGQIIYMVDNPLFRSFWYDGKLLFANAIFFAGN